MHTLRAIILTATVLLYPALGHAQFLEADNARSCRQWQPANVSDTTVAARPLLAARQATMAAQVPLRAGDGCQADACGTDIRLLPGQLVVAGPFDDVQNRACVTFLPQRPATATVAFNPELYTVWLPLTALTLPPQEPMAPAQAAWVGLWKTDTVTMRIRPVAQPMAVPSPTSPTSPGTGSGAGPGGFEALVSESLGNADASVTTPAPLFPTRLRLDAWVKGVSGTQPLAPVLFTPTDGMVVFSQAISSTVPAADPISATIVSATQPVQTTGQAFNQALTRADYTSPGFTQAPECRMALRLLGNQLMVQDNGRCGATYTGAYLRN